MDRVDVVRIKPDFNEELIKLNLGKALKGDTDNDIVLQGLDRVQVYGVSDMVPKTSVSIVGHVKFPGRFLLQDNMTLYDLIFKAGGFVDEEFRKNAFLDRADLLRLNDDNVTRTIISFNLGELLDSPDLGADTPLQANDIIKIYSKDIFINNKVVSINGVVRRPGTYNLKTGMRIKDLILEAGGLNENVYRYRVEIARIDPLNTDLEKYAQIIVFNMNEKFGLSSPITNDDAMKDMSSDSIIFQLKPYDLVSIRPDPYFGYQKEVTIVGEVLYPGSYVILRPSETITDIIKRAGGLRPNAYLEGSVFYREGGIKINSSFVEIVKNPKSKMNFNVRNGDIIEIGQNSNIVTLKGEVNRPGSHKYLAGKRLRHYLKLAGGLNQNADKDNIWIEYPNGSAKKLKNLSIISPKVLDGSVIVIGIKEEEEDFNHTEYAKDLTAIIANLAQAITVVALAIR